MGGFVVVASVTAFVLPRPHLTHAHDVVCCSVCYPCNGNPYPASQVEKTPKGQVCQAYLGTLDDAVWSLLDSSNPKAGVALTYTHGQGNKSTRIAFVCDPQVRRVPCQPTCAQHTRAHLT